MTLLCPGKQKKVNIQSIIVTKHNAFLTENDENKNKENSIPPAPQTMVDNFAHFQPKSSQ